mmetsp:Transcript_23142/g.45537  ORF Transcript_23142/g.45537 Transcript_23142/m.45537 type:complete len:131 (-) Transcript_23142:957-1349(-)
MLGPSGQLYRHTKKLGSRAMKPRTPPSVELSPHLSRSQHCSLSSRFTVTLVHLHVGECKCKCVNMCVCVCVCLCVYSCLGCAHSCMRKPKIEEQNKSRGERAGGSRNGINLYMDQPAEETVSSSNLRLIV